MELLGGPDPGGFGARAAGPFGSCSGVDREQLIDLHGVGQCFSQSAVYVGNGRGGQRLAITATVFCQFAVQHGDHGRSQGLEPDAPNAGHDVVIDVVTVARERLGLHSRGVGLHPLSQVASDG